MRVKSSRIGAISDFAYGATIGLRGAGSIKRGQAYAFDGLRARVSSWQPLRPARLRSGCLTPGRSACAAWWRGATRSSGTAPG